MFDFHRFVQIKLKYYQRSDCGSGERLDHRSCEALEVVLKSLYFDFINLQAAQLEENGASSLLDMILYYESTTHLDISDNSGMGTSCWRALAHLIKQRGVPAEDHCLRSEGPLIAGLGARGGVDRINPTDSNIWFPLCLMTMLAFHMQPNRLDQICGIDLDARAARAEATRTRVPQYSTCYTNTQRVSSTHTHKYKVTKECYLIFTAVIAGGGDSCCAPFSCSSSLTINQSIAVGALKSNRSLQELHLTNNLLNSYQDALQLGDLLRYNNTLLTLELSNNSVADAVASLIVCYYPSCISTRDALPPSPPPLYTGEASRHALDVVLPLCAATQRGKKPVLKVLQVLDLGENLLGNEGIQAIREPLMVNSSVLQLGLAQADITCEGAVALAEFLAESRQIEQLDLRQNEVKVGGLMALCLALRINRSLTNLHLDHSAPQEQWFSVCLRVVYTIKSDFYEMSPLAKVKRQDVPDFGEAAFKSHDASVNPLQGGAVYTSLSGDSVNSANELKFPLPRALQSVGSLFTCLMLQYLDLDLANMSVLSCLLFSSREVSDSAGVSSLNVACQQGDICADCGSILAHDDQHLTCTVPDHQYEPICLWRFN
ncbi:Protein phosphatase 1 regulatory subunit 37 [Collichthys lucidus]|uniref:Protein phosphatase 1 regulatory subunit 37 n=1 Tax=Collichthys lucidus TaxID=240159 RepID=A0A4U5VDG9_COLLU|nr:Protein phosphatase 1 regulatory subunit 37 [Collichthys lucidus]